MEHSLIQLTILDTSKPVLINVEEVLLIEQKAPQDGGMVYIYMTHGKEFPVAESYEQVARLLNIENIYED